MLCWILLKIHVRLRSPHIFFWIGIISLFILPSVADPFIPEFKGSVFSVWFKSNIETLIHAQAIAFVALSAFYALNKLLPIASYSQKPFNKGKEVELFFPIFLLALSLIPILELIQRFGPLFFINLSFTDRRESLSYLGQFLLSYNVICAAGLVYWAYSQNRKFLTALSAVYYLAIFSFIGGSRQPIIAVFLPFFAFYIFDARQKFLKLGTIILTMQMVISALATLLVLRNQASIYDRIDLLLNPAELLNLTIDRPSDTTVRFAFYYYIENFEK